jgi:hypothetical protein
MPVLKQSPEIMTTTCHHQQSMVIKSNIPINGINRDKIQQKKTFLANIKPTQTPHTTDYTKDLYFQHMRISISHYSLTHVLQRQKLTVKSLLLAQTHFSPPIISLAARNKLGLNVTKLG